MQGFDGAAFDRWLTTDPRDCPSDEACVICGDEPEYDYDGGGQWGTVVWGRNQLPVCSLECACTVAAGVEDPAGRVAASRCVLDQLCRSDDYLPATITTASGNTMVGTILASAGGCVSLEDGETGGLAIVPWARVTDVVDLSV